MKKKKKAVEVIKIPNSRATSIVTGVCIGIMAIFILFALGGAFFPSFAIFLWKSLIIPFNSIFYWICQIFAFKIGAVSINLIFIIVFFVFMFVILEMVYLNSSKLSMKEKKKKVQKCRIIYISLVTLEIVIVFLGSFLCNNNPKLDTLYFKEEVDNVYTLDDLYQLNDLLEKKVFYYADIMKRDSSGHILYTDIEKQAVHDLTEASSKYEVFKGIYPLQYYAFNDYDLSHDPSTYGLTGMGTVGVNYNQEAPSLLNTITHELCHTRGIVRENEATLCSIIVGIESDNPLSQYSAYFEAYGRSLDAMSQIDIQKYRESSNRFYTLCTDKKYAEVCNYARKDTKLYVRKSDSIQIVTYPLDLYHDDFSIKDFLESLEKYSLELKIDDEEIKIDELDSYLDSDKSLVITIKNSKKIFQEVQELLDSNKEEFRVIAQIYPDMYVGVEMDPDEAIEYYTSSIPNSNIFDSFNFEKTQEVFDYSRVVRLILEYFDSENI